MQKNWHTLQLAEWLPATSLILFICSLSWRIHISPCCLLLQSCTDLYLWVFFSFRLSSILKEKQQLQSRTDHLYLWVFLFVLYPEKTPLFVVAIFHRSSVFIGLFVCLSTILRKHTSHCYLQSCSNDLYFCLSFFFSEKTHLFLLFVVAITHRPSVFVGRFGCLSAIKKQQQWHRLLLFVVEVMHRSSSLFWSFLLVYCL